MANQVLHENFKQQVLALVRTWMDAGQAYVFLFVNDIEPEADTSYLVSFTQPTDSGYAGHEVNFDAPTVEDHVGQMLAPGTTWTFSHDAGDFTIYGIWMTRHDFVDGHFLVSAMRLDEPVPVTVSGQTFTVTPKMLCDLLGG